jgi:hypothetical protein
VSLLGENFPCSLTALASCLRATALL